MSLKEEKLFFGADGCYCEPSRVGKFRPDEHIEGMQRATLVGTDIEIRVTDETARCIEHAQVQFAEQQALYRRGFRGGYSEAIDDAIKAAGDRQSVDVRDLQELLEELDS